jgi:hypothetical protein
VMMWLVFFVLAAPVALVWLGGVLGGQERKVRSLVAWLSAPVVCTAAVVLSATDVPLIARFYLSKSALQNYADRGPAETSRVEGTQVIGLFRVAEVWRHGRTVAFQTDDKIFGRVGVIYAPDGPPTELPMEVEELLWARYTHIGGSWYRYETGD